MIVGENNIGKSTIFEALILWKLAYDTLIQQKNKNKFYKASTNYYLPFSALNQVRLINDNDFFHDASIGKASITLTIKDEDEVFSLKFRFEKPGIKNSYLRLFNDEYFVEFERFSDHVLNKPCSLRDAIFIYQTRPISTISKNEPFYNNAQIEKKISIGKSHDVLRNKILKTENSQVRVSERLSRLEGRLERVLKKNYTIRFKNRNRTDDEYVKITSECSEHKELEISMMGSGFLQVVKIFSTIEYIVEQTDGICLILIDEPDSHIHSNLQSHLIDELKNHDNSQIYVITHNDRLYKKATDGELYYLNATVKEQGLISPLEIDDFPSVQAGLASILNELENNDGIPLILTEGKTDQKILNTAWGKLYGEQIMPYKIISSGIEIDESSRTGSADSVRRSLEFISTLTEQKIIGLFDNDREGNVRFKGLNQQIFDEHNLGIPVRKHLVKDIFGMLLPTPHNRNIFVTNGSLKQRYLVIEHYFSDEILDMYNMRDEPILGTEVFEINGRKNTFADNCENFDENEFDEFRELFNKFSELLGLPNN